MSKERTAKEAVIFSMLEGIPSLQGQISAGMVEAMVAAVDDCRVDAVAHACRRFNRGEVEGHNAAFAPSAGQLAAQARLFDTVLRKIDRDKEERPVLISYPIGGEPPPPAVPLGPLSVDFGSGPIDMRDMSPADKEFVLANKRRPDEIEQAQVPKLQRMPK